MGYCVSNMWPNFLCSIVLLAVSYSDAFPYYAPEKYGVAPAFQQFQLPWWYEHRAMMPPPMMTPPMLPPMLPPMPSPFLPFSRFLSALPRLCAPIPRYLMLAHRYIPDCFSLPEPEPEPEPPTQPEYIIRIYMPEKVESNSSTTNETFPEQIETSKPNQESEPAEVANEPFETTIESPQATNESPEATAEPIEAPAQPIQATNEPTELPQAQNDEASPQAAVIMEIAQEAVAEPDVVPDPQPELQTSDPSKILNQDETTGAPIEKQDMKENVINEEENAQSLVNDTQGKTDELKAVENEIEDVKTQEMEKGKEGKIDGGNDKVDVLKADLYQTSDKDQSLSNNSV